MHIIVSYIHFQTRATLFMIQFIFALLVQVGTAVTNAFINARKVVNTSSAGEVENVPILSTSAAYGVYMAVSSNLRYPFFSLLMAILPILSC